MRKLTLLVIMVLLFAFLVSCATEEPVDTGEVEPTPVEIETIHWTAQSPWPPGTTLHWMAEEIARQINEASGGRLVVEMLPVGAVVGALDLLDSVDTGVIDAAHNWDGYWVGKEPAAGFFASMPLGLNEQEYMTWVLHGEGRELWEELWDDYEVKVLPAGCYTPEIFLHSHVPVTSVEDMVGMKIRGVGHWGPIQEKFGVSAVAVAGGEVFPALERGVVDAIEYATPSDNWTLGFHEIAEYVVVPGAHQPTSTFSFLVNQEKWDELPDDLKAIVRIICDGMWANAWAYAASEDMKVMAEYEKLQDEGKLTIVEFPPEEQQKLKEYADEYYAELAAEDEFFDKVWRSQLEFLEKYRYWRGLMTPAYE